MPAAQSMIGEIKPDTKIYRIFPQMRFFSLFEEKKNTLLKPKKWNDPFENVFLNSSVMLPSGEVAQFGFHDDVFGQCWTLHTASDAMWQIYSKNEEGIRVRTTVGKLIDSMRAAHGMKADVSCFIGRVRYQTDSQLKQFGKSMFAEHSGAEAIAQSLLVKRNAYKHENEVRLIYIAPDPTKKSELVYKYDIDPLGLFDQAMVDGRVGQADFVTLKERIARWTGLPKYRIKRSLLYSPPKGFVVHMR